MEKVNKLLNRSLDFFENGLVLYPVLFFLSLLLFTWLLATPGFPDPDAFYHAKMSVLTAEQGTVLDFPWLQLTNLKIAYTDQHFLFHAITVPFLTYFSPLVALKISSVLLASLAICLIAAVLRYLRVRGVFWWSLLLLTFSPFIIRLSLAKASPLALVLLLLGVLFILKKKWLSLFLLSIFYVWSHGGFILIFVMSLLYFFGQNLANWMQTRQFHRVGIGAPIASFLGICVGLVVNPYFPNNLQFYWQQVIEIGLVNYQKYFGVGAEWYPYNLVELVSSVNFIFILLVLAILITWIHYHRQRTTNWYFLMVIVMFFLFTLKSRRYVEYFVPFAFIWSILVIDSYIWTDNFKVHWEKFKEYTKIHKLLIYGLCVYFGITLIFGFALSTYRTKQYFEVNSIPFDKFEEVGDYLEENDIKGKIIFHTQWDEFPVLFFENTDNYYLAGMDPTFSYKYDPVKFYQWINISEGKQKQGLVELIKRDFDASYVVVDLDEENAKLFLAYIKRDPRAEVVLEGEDSILFKLQ